MAEGLLKEHVGEDSDIHVESAGIAAGSGQRPSEHSVTVMEELGIDITNQRSQPLTPTLIEQADRLFVMTYSHMDAILMRFPEASEKTFLARHFIEDDTLLQRDISDPIGQSVGIYRNCRDEIASAMDSIKAHLDGI